MEVDFAATGTTSVIVHFLPPFPVSPYDNMVRRKRDLATSFSEAYGSLPSKDVAVTFRGEVLAIFGAEVNRRGLELLRKNPYTGWITKAGVNELHLAQSVPQIQAAFSQTGFTGAGTTICIVDSGVDYDHVQLGGPGFPNAKVLGGKDFGARCSVTASTECSNSGQCPAGEACVIDLNDNDPKDGFSSHGTQVSGIAAATNGVAPGAKLVVIDVQTNPTGPGGVIFDQSAIMGIDWCIANKDNFSPPIKAINLSLGRVGQVSDSTTVCDDPNGGMGSVGPAANDAVDAGLVVIASSGNDAFSTGTTSPACASKVISAGAVYDADFGALSFASCSDPASQTDVDKMSCITNTGAL